MAENNDESLKQESAIEESAKKLREAKDRIFKETVNLAGFKEKRIVEQFYSPDKAFEKDKTIVIMESSSTGDRKVHIGELTQFLSYCSNDKQYDEYYFVLYLSGKSKSAPKANTEIKRLQKFYDSFSICKTQRIRIKKIAIVNQPDDKELESLTLAKVNDYEGIVL